jgi:hypothetical protein
MTTVQPLVTRAGLVVLLVVAVVAVGACSGLTAITGPREWSEQLTAGDGTTQTVTVRDTSGRITTVEFDPAGVQNPGGITNPDGNLEVLLVPWTGGACDVKTVIEFAAAGDGLKGTMSTETSGDVCIMVAVQHLLRLTTNTPTPAASVTLETVPAPAG